MLNQQQIKSVENTLAGLTANSLITGSKFAVLSDIDNSMSTKVLTQLTNEKVLLYQFGIRCPKCGLLLRETDSLADFDESILCYNCEENVDPTKDDVEVFYCVNKVHPLWRDSRTDTLLS